VRAGPWVHKRGARRAPATTAGFGDDWL